MRSLRRFEEAWQPCIDKDVQHSCLSSYADDTRIWKFIVDAVDQKLLQDDLISLYMWSDDNNASWNDDKFEHMGMGPPGERSYNSRQDLS